MNVTPDKPIVIGGKTYVLRGILDVLKDIQNEFDQDIFDIAQRSIIRFRFEQLARIIEIAIGEGAPDLKVIEAEIVQEIGLDEVRYLVWEWLVASISPKRDREKNVVRLLDAIAKMREATAAIFRGETTDASA